MHVWRSPKIEVRPSRLGGRGVFACQPIDPGEVVAVKVGHVVDTEEMERLTRDVGDYGLQIHEHLFLSPRSIDEVEAMVVLINHSCDANVGFDGQVTYVALRSIEPDEELCHDYAMMRTTPYSLECACGAADCRGIVTGDDWALPSVQAKYGRFFQPHILDRIRRGIMSTAASADVPADRPLSVEDRLEIHELPGRYGDAIDDRDWARLDQVFTEDAVFDLTGVGSRVCTGLDDIKDFMEREAAHPRTHLMTNVYADADGDGAQMRSRIVALLGKGRTGTASYYDTLVRTPDGWRIKHRVCSTRRVDKREAEVDRQGIAL